MDKSHIDKYKSEMMKLYGLRCQEESPAEKIPETPTTEPLETPAETEEFLPEEGEIIPDNNEEDTAYDDFSGGEHSESTDDFNQRFPEPDLSDLETDSGTLENENSTPPEYGSQAQLGDFKGFILVNVRTADESSPVGGAAVAITALVDGQRMILASGLTDENGTTRKLEVPVPDSIHSQAPDPKIRPYTLYDVTVSAEGFFNARSVDVPVFAGITSVQNFSMIPTPTMTAPDSETLIYYNREPNFTDRKE